MAIQGHMEKFMENQIGKKLLWCKKNSSCVHTFYMIYLFESNKHTGEEREREREKVPNYLFIPLVPATATAMAVPGLNQELKFYLNLPHG